LEWIAPSRTSTIPGKPIAMPAHRWAVVPASRSNSCSASATAGKRPARPGISSTSSDASASSRFPSNTPQPMWVPPISSANACII
jgi:hypothetical protein